VRVQLYACERVMTKYAEYIRKKKKKWNKRWNKLRMHGL